MKQKTLILLTLSFLFLFFSVLSLEATVQCGAGSDQYYNPSGCFSVNADGNPICSSLSMCTSETNTLCKTPEGCICGPCNIIDGYTTPVNPKRNNESCSNYPLCEQDNPVEEQEDEQEDDDETIDYCADDSDSVYNSNGCYEVNADNGPICSSNHMCTSISQVACKRPNGCNCFVDGPDVCENDDADPDADNDDIGDDESYEPEPAAKLTFLNCDSNDAFGEEFCDKMDGEIPLLGVEGENYLAFLTTNNLEMMLAIESPACLLYIGHNLEHLRNMAGSEIPITKPEVAEDGDDLTFSNFADGVEAAFICNLPPEEESATALIGIGNITSINYTATLVFSITAELYPVTVEYKIEVSSNGDDAGTGADDIDNGEGAHIFKLEGESTPSVTITADFSLDDETKLLTEEEALELFSNDMEEAAMDIMSAAGYDEVPEENAEEDNDNDNQGEGNGQSIISCSLITTNNQSLGLKNILPLLTVPIILLSLLIVFRSRKNS